MKTKEARRAVERAIRRAAKAQSGDFAAYQRRIENARRIAAHRHQVAL